MLLAIGAGSPSRAGAEPAESRATTPARPFHILAAVGGYGALGSPASYGPTLALDVMPGGFAGRYGLRGEWRGYGDTNPGSALIGLLFEAGASRPTLALHLVAQLGITADRNPIIGAGVETNLYLLGPIGITTLADVQIIVDGLATRPALSFSLAIHLGR